MAHSASTGARSEIPFELIAQPIALESVESKMSNDSTKKVVQEVLQNMRSDVGGVVIVLVDSASAHWQYFRNRIKTLDDRRSYRCFKQEAPNVFQHPLQFKILLKAFCAHSDNDRWQRDMLQLLAGELGYPSLSDAPHLELLESQPKDGAIVMDLHGTIFSAAACMIAIQV